MIIPQKQKQVISISYRITIKSLKGAILTYLGIESYTNEEGILTFINPKDGSTKRYSISNAEIEEEKSKETHNESA